MKNSAGKAPTAHPDFTDNAPEWMRQFSLPAETEQQCAALIKGTEPRFSRITWSETVPDGRTVEIILDSQPDGMVRRLEDDGTYKVQRIMIANEIFVLSAIDLTTAPIVLQLLKTNLSFPLQQGQRFRIQSVGAGKTSTWLSLNDSHYVVTGRGEARELDPALSGQYLRVECEHFSHEGRSSKQTAAWLEDLHIFMPLERIQDGKVQRVDWHNLKVIR